MATLGTNTREPSGPHRGCHFLDSYRTGDAQIASDLFLFTFNPFPLKGKVPLKAVTFDVDTQNPSVCSPDALPKLGDLAGWVVMDPPPGALISTRTKARISYETSFKARMPSAILFWNSKTPQTATSQQFDTVMFGWRDILQRTLAMSAISIRTSVTFSPFRRSTVTG